VALGTWLSPGTTTQMVLRSSTRDGVGPAIGFPGVPEGTTAKNRMHRDIRVAGEPVWDMGEREQLIRAKAADEEAASPVPHDGLAGARPRT